MAQGGLDWELIAMVAAAASSLVIAWDFIVSRGGQGRSDTRKGLLIYDRSGWMSVQIVSDPKPAVPRESSREGFLAAQPDEKVAAIDGYYAYFATWTVDISGSTVTHHIEESLYPGERGEDGVRRLTMDGNRLTLVAGAHEMGEVHERRLIWERVQTSSRPRKERP